MSPKMGTQYKNEKRKKVIQSTGRVILFPPEGEGGFANATTTTKRMVPLMPKGDQIEVLFC